MTSTLRLLLWLKWTLTWRAYRRSRSQIAGAILFVVFLLPFSGLCAFGAWTLLHDEPTLSYPSVRDILAAVFLLWTVTPLLGFSLNESFDLTRLFIFPIPVRRLFAGALLGGLLDRAVLLVLPVFGVILISLCRTLPTFLATAALLLFFLLGTLALGQAVMLLLIGFLRSRRFRDITIVVFPLLTMAYYLAQRLIVRRLEAGTLTTAAVVQAPAWRVADWLPPGWAAAGIHAAQTGNYGYAALSFLCLAAATTMVATGAAAALQGLYLGDRGPSRPQAASAEASSARANLTLPHIFQLPPFPWLPGEAGAVAWKEWVYLRRDPQYKALAVQSAYTLVVLAASIALPSLRATPGNLLGGDWLLWSASGVLLLSITPLAFNMWAGEGAAITALFSLPVSRRTLLLGKNAAHGTLLLIVSALGLAAVAALTHSESSFLWAFVWIILAVPVLLTAGNLMSVRFPHRMLVRGQVWGRGGMASASDGAASGCAYSLLSLLAYGATLAALLPVFAAAFVPGHWGIPAFWRLISLPLAAAYSAGLYVVLLGQAETWLLAREPEIIARIVPE